MPLILKEKELAKLAAWVSLQRSTRATDARVGLIKNHLKTNTYDYCAKAAQWGFEDE